MYRTWIEKKYPWVERKDFQLQNNSDGKGSYIVYWKVKDEQGNPITKPSHSEYLAEKQAFRTWRLAEKARQSVVVSGLKTKLKTLGFTDEEIQYIKRLK